MDDAVKKIIADANVQTALSCPRCERAVYRLTISGRLARWHARLTKRRPYACADCGWQGTLAAADASWDVIDQLTWFRAREPKSPRFTPQQFWLRKETNHEDRNS